MTDNRSTLDIRVGSVQRGDAGEYCGRPSYGKRGSPLGNPFSHDPKSRGTILVATREEAVARYDGWLKEKVRQRDRAVLTELERLLALAQQQVLTLVCWCAPRACHCDVIAVFLKRAHARRQAQK